MPDAHYTADTIYEALSACPNASHALAEARRLAPIPSDLYEAVRHALKRHGIPEGEIATLRGTPPDETTPLDLEPDDERPSPAWASTTVGVVTDVYADDKNGRFKDAYHEHSVIALLRSIVDPAQRRLDAIQQVRQADKETQRKLKTRLPAVIWGGRIVGDHRRIDNFTNPSGLLFVDIDSRADGSKFTAGEAAAMRDRVFEDNRVFAAWVSASGTGVHCLMRFREPTTDRDAYAAIYEHISKTFAPEHGIRFDQAVKHPERVCYLSHDPDLRIREHGHTLVPVLDDVGEGVAVDDSADVFTAPEPELAKRIEAALAAIPQLTFPAPGSEKRNWILGVVGALSAYVEGEPRVLAAIRQRLEQCGRTDTDNLWKRDWWDSCAKSSKPGAFIKLCQEAGIELPRRPRGRPRTDKPTPAATSARSRTLEAKLATIEELADLRSLPAEQMDQRRAFKFRPGHFLRVVDTQSGGSDCYVRQPGGLWRVVERRRSDSSAGVVANIAEQGREEALLNAAHLSEHAKLVAEVRDEWADGIGVFQRNRLCEYISQTVAGDHPAAQGIQEVSSLQFNDRDVAPCIPIRTGGAWDIREAKTITPDELAQRHLLDIGWSVPEPQPDDLMATTPGAEAMRAAIEGRYAGLAERTACYLVGVSKSVDVVCGAVSSVGKTLWFDLVAKAFPGAVVRLDAKTALGKESKRFTPIAVEQAQHLIVVLDEVGHLDREVLPSDLNGLTGNDLTVERKGENVTTVRRIGNVVMVGHAWPKVKVDEQGVDTRVTWAHQFPDEYGAMPQAERDRLYHSTDAHAYLRAWLLSTAHDLLLSEHGPWRGTTTPESTASVKAFYSARRDIVVQWLLAAYEVSPKRMVTTASVKEALAEELGKDAVPSRDNELAKSIKVAFPDESVQTGKVKTVEGKRQRCIMGLAARTPIEAAAEAAAEGQVW